MELSNSTVSLVGVCFIEALDAVNVHTLHSAHDMGLALVDALRRRGVSIDRERFLDARGVRTDDTQPLPVLLTPQAG
jgi:hypothetical protein